MQGPAWIGLFRLIPTELHDSLVLVLTTGLEVILQSIVRVDRDFMVVRCRMAGSQDSGRLVIIPFDQVNFMAFNKKLTEAEAIALLGKQQSLPAVEPNPLAEKEPLNQPVPDEIFLPVAPATAAVAPPDPPAVAPSAAPPVVSDKPAEVDSKEVAPAAKVSQISKSILLARLRARLTKDGPGLK